MAMQEQEKTEPGTQTQHSSSYQPTQVPRPTDERFVLRVEHELLDAHNRCFELLAEEDPDALPD